MFWSYFWLLPSQNSTVWLRKIRLAIWFRRFDFAHACNLIQRIRTLRTPTICNWPILFWTGWFLIRWPVLASTHLNLIQREMALSGSQEHLEQDDLDGEITRIMVRSMQEALLQAECFFIQVLLQFLSVPKKYRPLASLNTKFRTRHGTSFTKKGRQSASGEGRKQPGFCPGATTIVAPKSVGSRTTNGQVKAIS
jgi:hypothetical protein